MSDERLDELGLPRRRFLKKAAAVFAAPAVVSFFLDGVAEAHERHWLANQTYANQTHPNQCHPNQTEPNQTFSNQHRHHHHHHDDNGGGDDDHQGDEQGNGFWNRGGSGD
jgi:hypothetical protein